MKNYKILYWIFLVIGLLGIVDLATTSMVKQAYNLDMGYVSFGSFFILKLLLGVNIASSLSVIISFIFRFSIIWLGLAYFMNKKSKMPENPTEEDKKSFKRAKVITWVILGIFLIPFSIGFILPMIANSDRKSSDSLNQESQQWETITAKDNRFSVDLPKNPVFYPSTPGQIEGYSYLAYDQNRNIAYVVKYENYHASIQESGIEVANASEEVKQKLLKLIADSSIKDMTVSNFSSEFFTYHGYSAIRYGGVITKGSENGNMKGAIILVGESVYTISVLEKTGYTADFDRVLNSLIIK